MTQKTVWIVLRTPEHPEGQAIEVYSNQNLGDLRYWLSDPTKPPEGYDDVGKTGEGNTSSSAT